MPTMPTISECPNTVIATSLTGNMGGEPRLPSPAGMEWQPDPSPLLAGARWFCVLGFVLSCTFPGLQGMLNVFGGICAILFLHALLLRRETHLPARSVRIALFLFLLTALVFVLYPPWGRGAYPLGVTLGTYWHTLRGVAAAGVLLSVVRTPCALGYMLLLYPCFAFMTVIWMHASRHLWALGHYEELGNSNILGMRIYLAVVAGWMVLILPSIRKVALSRWMICSGYLFAAFGSFFLLRAFPTGPSTYGHGFPEEAAGLWYILPLALGVAASIRMLWQRRGWGTWLLLGGAISVPPLLYAGSVLPMGAFRLHMGAVLLMGLGWGIWWAMSRPGWWRVAAVVALMVHGFVFLLDMESRQAIVMMSVVVLALGAAYGWGLRRGVLPLVITGMALASAWAGAGFPGVPDNAHWRQHSRQIVWMHSVNLGKAHPWLGHGYGFRAFQSAWEGTRPEMPPWLEGKADPELLNFRPMHAHNIFVQFFVERGILGLLCAMGLWGVVLWALGRRAGVNGGEGGRHARVGFVFVLLFPLQQMVDYTMQGTAESYFWIFFALLMAYGVPGHADGGGGMEDGGGTARANVRRIPEGEEIPDRVAASSGGGGSVPG